MFRFGGRVVFDDRDYRRPVSSLVLPLNYYIPGRIVVPSGGFYHFYRDLGYPERGGLVELEAEVVTRGIDVDFVHYRLQAQRYITLFWKDRILAVRA